MCGGCGAVVWCGGVKAPTLMGGHPYRPRQLQHQLRIQARTVSNTSNTSSTTSNASNTSSTTSNASFHDLLA